MCSSRCDRNTFSLVDNAQDVWKSKDWELTICSVYQLPGYFTPVLGETLYYEVYKY